MLVGNTDISVMRVYRVGGKSLLVSGMGFVALLVAGYISLALPESESCYKMLPLLPLSFGLLLIISPKMHAYSHRPSIVMLLCALAIRYIVIPLMLVCCDAYEAVGTILPTEGGMDTAFMLMLYEMVCIFAVVAFAADKWLGMAAPITTPVLRFNAIQGQIVVPIIIFLGLATAIFSPSIMQNYRFYAFAVGDYVDNSLARSGGAGYLMLLVEWARILLCLFIVNWLWRHYQRRPVFGYAVLSIIAFLPVLMIASRTSRTSILFPAISALILLLFLYPKWRRAITIGTAGLLVTVILTISLAKNFGSQLQYSGVKQADMLPSFLHSYGSPVQRVENAIETAQSFSSVLSGWQAFLADSLANVPLIGRLVGATEQTTTTVFNFVVYSGDRARDQIMPMIGQSLYHWGVFAAPFYSMLTLLLAFRLDYIVARERRLEFLFVHTMLMFRLAVGSTLGNWALCVSDTVTMWIPLCIILWLNRKIVYPNVQFSSGETRQI